jgi:PEP-CTERM motif
VGNSRTRRAGGEQVAENQILVSVWFTNGLVSIPLCANFPLGSDFFSSLLDAPCHNHERSSRLLASAEREMPLTQDYETVIIMSAAMNPDFFRKLSYCFLADIRSILEDLGMRKLLLASAATSLGLLVSGVSAQAALEKFDVSFTAGGFASAYSGQPAPEDPVTGSFTIVFDPTLTYTDSTAGITQTSLNIVSDSALSFDYSPTGNGNGFADELVVGGIEDGAGSVQYAPSTNDFILHIYTFTTGPVFQQVVYSQTTYSDALWYNDPMGVGGPEIGYGSVTVTEVPVPEPSTWAMMGLGFAGLGFLAYRKRAALAFA